MADGADGPDLAIAPWQKTTKDGLSFRAFGRRAHAVIEILRSRGIRIPPSNRLSRAAALLERIDRATPPWPARVLPAQEAAAAHAIQSIFDASLVASAIEISRPPVTHASDVHHHASRDPFPNDRVRQLLFGADSPVGERKTMARDVAFEALTGAVLVLGGLDARPEEPDYLTTIDGETIGIAAKRCTATSPAAVTNLVQKATEQLRRANVRGFAFLSVDQLLTHLPSGAPAADVGAHFSAQVAAAHRALDAHKADPRLLGGILLGRHVTFAGPPARRQIRLHAAMQVVAYTGPLDDVRRIARFEQRFRGRLFERIGAATEALTRPD